MGGMKRHLLDVTGMVKADLVEMKREAEAQRFIDEFERHCAIANNTYPLMESISSQSRLYSQLVASVGYAAFVKHRKEMIAVAG